MEKTDTLVPKLGNAPSSAQPRRGRIAGPAVQSESRLAEAVSDLRTAGLKLWSGPAPPPPKDTMNPACFLSILLRVRAPPGPKMHYPLKGKAPMGRRSRAFAPGRREFLREVSLAGVAGLLLPRAALGAWHSASSRVITVHDTTATSSGQINASVVQVMVDSGIRSLAQAGDVGEAWKSLLPGVSSASVIAIKVNCINSAMSSHPAVAYAVANSLTKMSFGGGGFPENNIVIFDRTNGELRSAGYTLNTSTTGVRCFGTDSSGVGYSTTTYDVAGSSQRLSNVLTQQAEFLINLAVLKNHTGAGVTLCLKNHYGTCNRPEGLHSSWCDPHAAALSTVSPIRTRQRVNIIDALFGIRSGGPGGQPQFVANRLIMSADIVAADCIGRKLLQDNGCTSVVNATHIDTASTTYGLGTNDPAQMDLVTILNPSTTDIPSDLTPSEVTLYQNYPNPFNPATYIRFEIPERSAARLDIVDTAGRLVSTLLDGPVVAGVHTAMFDGTSHASGVYFARLRAGTSQQMIKMTLVK